MVDLIQTYLSSDAEERRSILKRVVSELKHLSESEPFEAEKALRQLINA